MKLQELLCKNTFFRALNKSCTRAAASHLVSHVWQVLKAHWRAEHLVMHIHDLVLVTAGVQVVHRILYDIQSLVAGCLQVVLSR